jgi:dinuclear metal center YbgI/SA1388 family protein
MLLSDLDSYFRSILNIEEYQDVDSSLNGIQVSGEKQEIRKVAFSVDACLDSIKRAADWGADMLFVHHGLFWGKPEPLTGIMFDRISTLIRNGIVLYAAHLPLDSQTEIGNNAGMARALGLEDLAPFGEYKGRKIGYKGRLTNPGDIDAILRALGLRREDCLGIFPFGEPEISSVGIVSGGATREITDALKEKLDLFITGDVSHEIYHFCLEGEINCISAGHYQTEVWGVKQLAEKLTEEKGLETTFIDVPTGL